MVTPQPYLLRTIVQLVGWVILIAAGLRIGLRWSGYRTGDALLDRALSWVATEPRTASLTLLALLPLLIMLGEALVAWRILQAQARRYDRAAAPTLLRILLPQIGSGVGARGPRTPDQDLFRAIAGAIQGAGRRSGRAPWATWTLQGAPQEPVTLGVAVGAADPQQAAQCAANVGTALEGLAPLGLVERQADPVRTQLTAGRTAVWQHWTLALPSQYPVRLLDDVEQSPPLAGLLTALRPFGSIVATESQLVVQAATGRGDWTLRRGWRGAATALKLQLEAKQDFALRDDVAALDAKLGGVPYVVTLRVVVIAAGGQTEADARTLLDQYGAALGAYQLRIGSVVQRFVAGSVRSWTATPGAVSPRALRRVLERAPEPTAATPLLLPTLPVFWPEPLGLSSAELGGLWHLPTAALGPLVRWMPCRALPAPPHAFIDEEQDAMTVLPSTGHPSDRLRWERRRITIGHAAQLGGVLRPVGPTVRDLRQILHLTAGMGAGKTQLLANMLQQLLPVGCTLIDGKGDDQGGSLAAFMRRLLPIADERRLVLLDVLDLDWPIALNPLARVDLQSPGGVDRALGQIRAIFGRIDPATWHRSVGMQQYLDMATLLVLHGEARPTLAQVKQALVDEVYRARLLATVRNPEVETFWQVTFPNLGDGQKTSRDALLRRFDMLLTAETTRYLVTQAAPSWSLLDAIEGGGIVLVPLPDMALGGMAGVIGTLVFQEFVRAAFGRPGDDQTRATYPLVVDEFQILLAQGATEDVSTALTRLRSLGICGVYAHQLLGQLGDLQETMQINAQSRVVLQTGEPDASAYARQFAATGITAADISGQPPRGHQYASLLCGGQPTGLFSLRPLPWPVPEPLLPAVEPPVHAWQREIPPDSPNPAYDRQIVRLAYEHTTDTRLAETLTRELSGAEWQRMQRRWTAIGQYQRQLLLGTPALIPDRLDRQRWLSRLLVARPLIFAEIEYRRQRPAIEASAATASQRTTRASTAGAGAAPAVSGAAGSPYTSATPDGNLPAVDPPRVDVPLDFADWQIERDD